MRWSNAVSLAGAMTVAALGIKAATLDRPEPADDIAAISARFRARLSAAGFATALIGGNRVIARRGPCRLKARVLDPLATNRAAYERLGAAFGPTRYAWHGRWFATPPTPLPLAAYYAQRELSRIGIRTLRRPVAAVAAAAPCAGLGAELFDVPVGQS